MKYFFILIVIFLSTYGVLLCQQHPILSKHLDDLYLTNPAARNSYFYIRGGEQYSVAVNVYHRSQWLSKHIEGSPMSSGLGCQWLLDGGKHIIGLDGFRDQWGSITNYYGKIRYAIDLSNTFSPRGSSLNRKFQGDRRSDDFSFILGVALHVEGLKLNLNKVSFNHPNDLAVLERQTLGNKLYSRASVGFSTHYAGSIVTLRTGGSVSQLIEPIETIIKGELQYKQYRQYSTNFSIILGKDDFKLELAPSISFVENSPMNFSGVARGYWSSLSLFSLFSFGVGYVKNSLQLEFNMILDRDKDKDQFRFGASWDIMTLQSYYTKFNNFSTFDLRFSYYL